MDRCISRRQILATSTFAITGLSLAGCLGDDDVDTPTPTPFGMNHVRLVNEQPVGYRSYEEATDGTFGLDEVVWFYFEPVGMETQSADAGEVDINLEATIEVYDPTDSRLMGDTTTIDRSIPENQLEELFMYFYFSPPLAADPGAYTAELALTDGDSGESDSTTVPFELTLGETTAVDHFGDYLSENLGIEISELRVEDETAELVYESPETSHGDGGFEIGFIASAFARYVYHGWPVDTIEVEVTYQDGSRYQFWIDGDDALAFFEGTISEDTYLDRVLDTVEVIEE